LVQVQEHGLGLERLKLEAAHFIQACYTELHKHEAEMNQRLAEVETQIMESGTYEHTYEELTHGCRMAWRNSNRCIGRLFWEGLTVFDARHVTTDEEMADALFKHIAYATNGGQIRPAITVFRPADPLKHHPDPRIWNRQLIRYAGYETDHGMVGDPDSLALTSLCHSLGWEGMRTPFDVLPLVISSQGKKPRWFDIPKELVLEVPIEHPQYPRNCVSSAFGGTECRLCPTCGLRLAAFLIRQLLSMVGTWERRLALATWRMSSGITCCRH